MIAPIAHTGQRSTTNLVPCSGRHITIKTVAGAALLRKGAVLQTYTVLPGYCDTTDDRLPRKAADNPHAKYNFSAKLKDPTSKGEEYIMFIGVSFDSAQLMSFELGELGEIEMDFTFDDYKYLKSIN